MIMKKETKNAKVANMGAKTTETQAATMGAKTTGSQAKTAQTSGAKGKTGGGCGSC